jgi:hypothetical protein
VSSLGNAPQAYPLGIWSFTPDGKGGGIWNDTINSKGSFWKQITRPYNGLMAFGAGVGYVLGGASTYQTSPETESLGREIVPLGGLVKFDMTSKDLSNSTVTGTRSTGKIQMGGMHYIPSFGPKGLFIVMGGDQPTGINDDLFDFNTVSILDPDSGQWYDQIITGNAPQPRKEFCVAGVESNNHTYEMYACRLTHQSPT